MVASAAAAGGGAAFGLALVGWPCKAKGAVKRYDKPAVAMTGKEVYAADLVKPEALESEIGHPRSAHLAGGIGTWRLPRSHPAFKLKNEVGRWDILPMAMVAMGRYETHYKRHLHNWFELRWATDEERGGPNGDGVTPRMLLLVGTVASVQSVT